MVREITSGPELRQVVGSGKLAVIDFTASWCGPCRMAAPQFEAMSQRYPDVIFAKVVEDNSRELIQSEGIRAFPTFRLYHNSQVLDEIQGANIPAVEAAVQRHSANIGPASFSGTGSSLGGGGGGGAAQDAAAAAEEARKARLKRLGIDPDSKPPAPAPKPVSAPAPASASASGPSPSPDAMDLASTTNERTTADLDKEDAEDEALLASMIMKATTAAAVASAGGGGGGDNADAGGASAMQMVEPPVDEAMLKQLLEFEFPELRAKKALLATGNNNLDVAIQWITDHQDDADIDEPIPLVPQLDLSALPGAGPPKKKLTVEELKERIAARRAERAEIEKVDEKTREKQRRESGKNILKTNEELQRLQRQREMAALKKEKEDQRIERERLRAEIAKDKAERASRNGRLPGRLDAEGYNPAGLQGGYGAAGAGGGGAGLSTSGSGAVPGEEPSEAARKASDAAALAAAGAGTSMEQAEKSIGLMKRQRIADGGGMAIKTLIAYVKNIVENPGEEKFRSINLENKAFKSRIAPVVGGVGLLRASGFVKDDAGERYYLAPDQVDVVFLSEVKLKLETALHEYAMEIQA